MSDRAEIAHVKVLLNDRLEELCAWLLPHGRRYGGVWVSNNPVTGDFGHEPHLRVYLTGIVGSWKDYRSGQKGDVLKLIQYVRETDFHGAMEIARDWLGLQRMSVQERRVSNDAARKRMAEAEAAAKRKEDAKRREAEKRFLSAAPYGSGTAAEMHARRFDIETRGIDLDAIRHLDKSTFRYHPALEYWSLAEWRKDPQTGRFYKAKAGPELPAIISAMRSATGQFIDHHCTFLDPVKPDKALLYKGTKKLSPRLMLLPNAGAVMRISHGPEGLPPEQSCQPHPLILGEGRETCLRLAQAVPEARVWACGSINGIRNAPVQFPFVSAIFVAGENDWEKPQALAQLDAALEALEASGKPVELMRPHDGSDFNDLGKE